MLCQRGDSKSQSLAFIWVSMSLWVFFFCLKKSKTLFKNPLRRNICFKTRLSLFRLTTDGEINEKLKEEWAGWGTDGWTSWRNRRDVNTDYSSDECFDAKGNWWGSAQSQLWQAFVETAQRIYSFVLPFTLILLKLTHLNCNFKT